MGRARIQRRPISPYGGGAASPQRTGEAASYCEVTGGQGRGSHRLGTKLTLRMTEQSPQGARAAGGPTTWEPVPFWTLKSHNKNPYPLNHVELILIFALCNGKYSLMHRARGVSDSSPSATSSTFYLQICSFSAGTYSSMKF